tara:strand:+ start:36246 stop:36536 length:291 start_codon:yes stop_codon:yes gene_type:complete
MGACTFIIVQGGGSAEEAFNSAVEEAHYEHGHSGYSGSIAEKRSFVTVKIPENMTGDDFIERELGDDDSQFSSKSGPAGCIELSTGRFAFFGWARE